jgi:regulator of sigma D
MSDNGIEYLMRAFKGFDSKLVTKTTKGYAMELNSENALTFVKNLFVYLSDNKALVFDETVKYVEEFYSNVELEGMTEEDKQEMFTELKGSRQEFYDFVDEAVVVLESGELDSYFDLVKGSKIKEEVYKVGNTYSEIAEALVVFEDTNMGSIVSKTSITPKTVEKVAITGNVISIEEVEAMYDEVENRINPILKMDLEWYLEDTEAMVTSTRLEGNTDFDFQPYIIMDGRIYLPLRYICESFGEEVSWDDSTKTAYIIRGEEKINMTGIIVDSKTMIKVRDFEKLGYKVGYQQVDDLSTATIEK